MKLSVQKRRRKLVSSPKRSVSHLKMVTRIGFVAKIGRFSAPNGDEIYSRRQKRAFSTSKRRRELVSSPKRSVSHLKMVTRFDLVAKIGRFSLQNDDENWFRRQNREFFGSKWWRDLLSSSKKGVFDFKTTTRTGLVAKKWSFPSKNDDENWSRRQNKAFFTSKWWRNWCSPIDWFSKVQNLSLLLESFIIVKNQWGFGSHWFLH